MARKTVTTVTYVDDFDGKPFEEGKGEAFDLTLNGSRFTLDLGSKNAEAFRAALAPWLGVAHEVAARVAAKGADPDVQNIRAFGREQGIQVAGQGRIGAAVRQAWEDAGRPAYDENGVRVAA